MRMIERPALAALSILIISSCAASDRQPFASIDAKANGKVDAALIELHGQFIEHTETNQATEQFEFTNPPLRIVDGQVLIDAVASENTAALEIELRALGATHLSSYGRIISCFFPISGIESLAGLDGLRFARPAYSTTRPK